MNHIRGQFFKRASQTKPRDSKEPSPLAQDIYPVHVLDSMQIYQKIVGTVMIFNDVLDPDVLGSSLSKLLERGDWKKLGGRLKRTVCRHGSIHLALTTRANRDLDGQNQKHDGGLEIHVPQKFSLAEPAIAFTHKSLTEMSINDHPVAKQLPRRMDAPFTQSLPASDDFRTLQVRDGFPTSLDAMIESGQPQLSLHIHSFKDATVVGLAWPHTLMDGVARADLMRNWSLVVAGQEDKIDQIVGARRDVLAELMTDVSHPGEEDLFNEAQQLKGFQLAHFASQWAWDKLAGSPKHWRAMYVPAAIYGTLVGKVKSEVNEMGRRPDRKVFIGEADALVATVAQKVALAEPKPRPLTIMTLFNCQCRIEQLRLCEGIYAQNMILLAYTVLSAHAARDTAAAIAINHRQHMVRQTTRSQIVHSLRRLCKEVKAGNQALPLRGQANSLMLAVNSLIKLDLITGVDFAAAVVREGDNRNARSNPPGTMLNFFFKEVNESIPYLNSFTCLGRDHAGGAWFAGYLSSRVWDALEQELQALNLGKLDCSVGDAETVGA